MNNKSFEKYLLDGVNRGALKMHCFKIPNKNIFVLQSGTYKKKVIIVIII